MNTKRLGLRCRQFRELFVWLLTSVFLLTSSHLRADETAESDALAHLKHFETRVAPVLAAKCVACHRPDNHKGSFDLTTRESMLKGGDAGPALMPGQPEASPLYLRSISTTNEKPEMPEKGEPLTADEASALREWISHGAPWPEKLVLKEKSKADASFWSLQPIRKIEPPLISQAPATWQANPVDAFIWQGLAEKQLQPNEPATPRKFIRRATYDLLGLPPTPEEVAAFEEECRATSQAATDSLPTTAVERLIDRLLNSPRYGEQWGRHWLDVIRFGESRGYERNEIITNLWPFRDYIIRSFNDDKPFDQLIHEHLAGDVIGQNQPEIEVGSAFLVAGPYDDVGNQDAAAAAQIRADQMDEMIRATCESFLGLTMGCARCHDHKFDPLTQRDYYALYATFSGTVHGAREVATTEAREQRAKLTKPHEEELARLNAEHAPLAAKLKGQKKEEQSADDTQRLAELTAEIERVKKAIAAIPALPVWWVGNHRASADPHHVFVGGSPQRRGELVTPASLEVLATLPSAYRQQTPESEGARRLALAKWLTSPDHPLTARVLANRVWHYHFGRGLVDTPSDFGYMGSRPTHPALLDWLALELQRGGWKLKSLHRLIMTSQAYRQSDRWNATSSQIDSDSRLLWRFPPRRLAAEEIRDSLLQIAGKLDTTMGGPGFRLYEYQQDNVATYVPLDKPGPETYRRAVYHHNARAARVDLLTDFDCPDPAFAEPRRAATTTPLQALTLMNHRFSLEMAGFLSERLARERAEPREQVERAFELTFARSPTERESKAALELIAQHGLRAFCRALLNSNELVYVN